MTFAEFIPKELAFPKSGESSVFVYMVPTSPTLLYH